MSVQDLKPTTITADLVVKALQTATNEIFMGDMASAETLRTLERATRKSLEDCLGARAASISVEVIRTDNVTAEISIGGPYDVLAPLFEKLGYHTAHSMSFEIIVPTEEPVSDSLPCSDPQPLEESH